MTPSDASQSPTLSISKASRVSGAARSILQRATRNGRLALQDAGPLAVVDLKRWGYIAPTTAAESLQALVRANREKAALAQKWDWRRAQLEVAQAQLAAALQMPRSLQVALQSMLQPSRHPTRHPMLLLCDRAYPSPATPR